MKFVFKCRITLASLFFFLTFTIANAQTDTVFWFAAPDLNPILDEPIYLRVTALDKNAKVTISQPANASFGPIVQNVSAFSNYTFELTNRLGVVENAGADVISNYGLLIRSTNKILVYYEASAPNNPDIFSFKASNSLGTEFIIASQKLWNSYSTDMSAFYVVATQDNTTITITPSVDLVGHTASAGAYTKTLNKGQVYTARATSHLGPNHVGGTIVTSDKPVAITMANDLTEPPGICGDLNGDQLIPVSKAGQEFILLPGGLTIGDVDPKISDLVTVYATENNTIVTVNGSNVDTINRAQFYQLANYNNTNYITTNKPAIVYQVSGFGCEVGGGVIPAIACTGSTTIGITRASTASLTLNILVKSGNEGKFTFNGSTSIITAADFSVVPNTNGEWKYVSKVIPTSTLAAGAGAIIKNSSPFHLAVINGGTTGGTRYGYFSGFGGFVPDVTLIVNQGKADLETDLDGTAYKWYRNGNVIPGATTKKYQTFTPGKYKVEVTYDAECPPVQSNEVLVPVGLSLDESKIEKRYCKGAHFNVSYTANIKRRPGNTFKVQLSNGTGSFTSPVEIGTKISTDSTGSIACIIPTTTTTSGQYRLRVISTDTAYISEDNGFDIAISPLVAPALAQDSAAACEGVVIVKPTSLGSHIKLPGTQNGYLTIPNTLANTNDFTFETWINLKSYDTWARIFDFGLDVQKYFLLTAASAPNQKPMFVITVAGNPNEKRMESNVKIPLNKWTHIAISIKGSTGEGKMYMDGVEVASSSTLTLTPASLPPTSNNYIGRSQYSFDPLLNAELDEMRFWDVARTPAQIIESFTTRLPAGTPNLAAYYKFDEGAGTATANDATGSSGGGTLQADVAWVTPSQSPSGAYDAYLWSNGDTTKQIMLDTSIESGKYAVKVTKDVGCMATSDSINVLIAPCCTYPSQGGTISRDQYICLDMQPARIQSVSRASGETGILQYKWQKSTVDATQGFEDIPGATDSTYQPPVLNQTTWYRRQAKVDCKEDWSGAANSNAVKMTVVPDTDRYLIIESLVQPTCNPPEGCTLTIKGLPMATWTLEQTGPVDATLTGMDNPFILEDLPDGVYQFRTADANGCIESPPFGVIVVTY